MYALLIEHDLLRPRLSLALRPYLINKGEREQHLEPMRPSRPSFREGKHRALLFDPTQQLHDDQKQSEIFRDITMKEFLVLAPINPGGIDLPVEPV